MSLSCYKDYSMVVNPGITPPSEYWRLDSLSGGKYVGSITGLQLTPTNIASISGVISNAVDSNSTIGNGSMSSAGSAALSIGTTGCSLSVWQNQIAAPHIIATGGTNLRIQWPDAKSIYSQLNYTNDPPVTFDGGVAITGGILSGPVVTVSTWNLMVVTLNISTNTVSLYINGSFYTSAVIPTNPTNPQATGSLSFQGVTTGPGEDCAIDEIGYWGNHVLTAAEVTALYNGGSGARPPGA